MRETLNGKKVNVNFAYKLVSAQTVQGITDLNDPELKNVFPFPISVQTKQW